MVNDPWQIAGVVIAFASLVVAIIGLRSPVVRRKLGLRVSRSTEVDVSATDDTTAQVDVSRSTDVKINIGRGAGKDD